MEVVCQSEENKDSTTWQSTLFWSRKASVIAEISEISMCLCILLSGDLVTFLVSFPFLSIYCINLISFYLSLLFNKEFFCLFPFFVGLCHISFNCNMPLIYCIELVCEFLFSRYQILYNPVIFNYNTYNYNLNKVCITSPIFYKTQCKNNIVWWHKDLSWK